VDIGRGNLRYSFFGLSDLARKAARKFKVRHYQIAVAANPASARRHCAPFNAPQHETGQTSLRSLHRMMASTHAIATNTAFASAPGAVG